MFSNTVGKDGRVIAIDIAQKFLDHVEKNSREAGQRNVETVLCKADSTELPPESVDVAFICDTYHHFEFPLKTMASRHRALKPGGRVILIDRNCNGIRPPLGSEVSVSIVAYITWLSTDQPIRMNSERPAGPHAVPQLKVDVTQADGQRGEKLYSARCAACHAENGQGHKENPPVWGARSFNDGAGLANVA